MSIRVRGTARSGRCNPGPACAPPVSACGPPNSVLVCATQWRERGQDEELSRRGRGDPRGVSQAQDRLHHVLPGSEWSPIWEALARQKLDNKPGPTFVESWHETLAVNMATGYTLITGRPQAVLVHAGVGVLQASMGIHGALQNEVPMVIMSGESQTLGEDPELDIEQQWYGGLSVGGIERFVEPFVKWARTVTSPYTLYESVIRAGEMAQRVPKGPIYLNVPLEHMLHDWTPPAGAREVPPAPVMRPRSQDVETVAELLCTAKSPVIVAETAGRNPAAFSALAALADEFAIPAINGRA